MSSISPIAGNAGSASAIAGNAGGASAIAGNAGQAAKTVDRDSDHGVSKPATSTARAKDIAAGINTVNIKA
jgi:hypothetical protein